MIISNADFPDNIYANIVHAHFLAAMNVISLGLTYGLFFGLIIFGLNSVSIVFIALTAYLSILWFIIMYNEDYFKLNLQNLIIIILATIISMTIPLIIFIIRTNSNYWSLKSLKNILLRRPLYYFVSTSELTYRTSHTSFAPRNKQMLTQYMTSQTSFGPHSKQMLTQYYMTLASTEEEYAILCMQG